VNRAQREADLQEWLPAATDSLIRALEWSAATDRRDKDSTTCILACGAHSASEFRRAVSMFVHVQDTKDGDDVHESVTVTAGAGAAPASNLTCYTRGEDGCFVWYEPAKYTKIDRGVA
jgi:hypothetical protein